MTTPTRTHTVAHQVDRLVIDADAGFDDLRQRYESLVPDIDMDALTVLIEKGDLDEVRRYTAERTPHTFARFWTFDPIPMMRLAGHHVGMMTYMMGNNVVVETMFRPRSGGDALRPATHRDLSRFRRRNTFQHRPTVDPIRQLR